MPNIAYAYQSLANIAWPAPGAAVAAGVTSCIAAPANALAGIGTPIGAPWPALLAAALHIGIYPGPAPVNQSEMIWRAATLYAAAQTDLAGNLGTTPLIGTVDPSEQGTLSYHMGSVLTALLGAVGLPTLNFMHLRRFQNIAPGLVVFATAQRPDFISWAAGGFQIWEAKGRVGGAISLPLRAGFDQTRSVAGVTIAGVLVPPIAYICCLARATAGTWNLYVTDPGHDIPMPKDPVLRGLIYAEYYRPFKEVLAQSPQQTSQVGTTTVVLTPLRGTDASFGMDQKISVALDQYSSSKSAADLADAIDRLIATGYDSAGPSQTINGNGLYFAVGESWLKH